MFSEKFSRNVLLFSWLLMLVSFVSARAEAAVSMPAFSLPTAVDGTVVNSESLKGKALLITFFATWCPPCRQEIPTLIQLHNEYKTRGFSVVAFSVDEGGARLVAKLVKKEKINYPVLMADRSTARSFGGIPGIPTSFLVNKKGHVVKKYPGFVPHSLLERDIKDVL